MTVENSGWYSLVLTLSRCLFVVYFYYFTNLTGTLLTEKNTARSENHDLIVSVMVLLFGLRTDLKEV